MTWWIALGWLLIGGEVMAVKSTEAQDACYRGEEFLAWEGALDSAARQEAERLVEERRGLISRLEEKDFVWVPTPFGHRLEEPEELTRLRQGEHLKIRALLPPGKEREFQAFRERWKQRVEEAAAAFPLQAKPRILLETTDDGNVLMVDLVIDAPSPLYQLEIDEVEETPEGEMVWVTWVRPPMGELVGKTAKASRIVRKAGMVRQGKLEVWLRTRDEDLPFRTEYQRVLVASLPLGE